MIGEKTFEAAAFDLITQSEWNAPELIKSKIITRINLLASALSVDKERLLAWLFLRTIISIQWFIEDNGDPSERLKLAEAVYPLISRS